MNRPDLMALLGRRVTVTHPHGHTTWTGKLVALADHPTMMLDLDDGRRVGLQQTCTVTPAVGADMAADPEADPALAAVERLATELYKAQDALAFARECCDVADQLGTPVTTALVRQWLDGAKCGRQILAEHTKEADRG